MLLIEKNTTMHLNLLKLLYRTLLTRIQKNGIVDDVTITSALLSHTLRYKIGNKTATVITFKTFQRYESPTENSNKSFGS